MYIYVYIHIYMSIYMRRWGRMKTFSDNRVKFEGPGLGIGCQFKHLLKLIQNVMSIVFKISYQTN